jgi:glycyl-tRNA synthetase beta chain
VQIFFRERVEFYLRDVCGYAYDVVKAVLASEANDVVDALSRANAVREVLHLPEFQAIGAACKRMRNILKQAEEKKIEAATRVESLSGSAEEEKTLIAFLSHEGARVEAHRAKGEYLEALRLLATARGPVDAFFDKVMVMVEDVPVRANRLALLRMLLREFSSIADFSEIAADAKA